MAKKRRKRGLRVGQSRVTTRKVGGKRRKVMVTKVGKNRYRIRVLGKKRRKKKRR